MSANRSFGSQVRLQRLFRHAANRLLVVPLDHSVADGPIVANGDLPGLVGSLVGNGVDAVVLHKGSLRALDPRVFTGTSLIVHLSASTAHAPDPDAKYLVSTVEQALRLGADAVSVHVNVGSADERRQVADLGAVADACDRWNIPLLAMMYPRGPRVANPPTPELVAHVATLAADMGADVVKSVYAGSVAAMADVVRACPVPVIVAGGPRKAGAEAVKSYVDEVLRAGAAGVAMGRNIFQAPDPGARAAQVAALVHGGHAGSSLELELAASLPRR
ncbi:2-amino-4,5-dihydroxy-6-oxo-7-(phosphonooxy)heptanoate synthase [Actinokineospora baliensis]|uniref:2-amino-3,7-dideoxy-D-threo-hept-6-ulosonate synthase n=1 Tax=Actinokineospora baliensis TaxID=547056 RepID=UPI00195EC7D5|nr:2-amino-3,7-dideoxy-D-threo-hept-6-ulosonate synthase [Actinokineospora baliensis]MBM7773199.1 2-amino-4,5-dihydroxy-6-oxo-7-(phosphonooxy)heptanoate synthase [Actinokineospora baliensis]